MRIACTIALVGVLLSACNKTSSQNVTQRAKPSERPQSIMVRVAKRAQACWFAKKDPAFKKYRLAAEVNSHVGKPRILIVPKNNPQGLPKLVAQAERKSGRNQFTSFGPLLSTTNGPRINAQLQRWAQGNKTC